MKTMAKNDKESADKIGQLKSISIKQQHFLSALQHHIGVVSKAAAETGISRGTHYEWMNENEVYATAVRELKNVALDFGESCLHDAMKAGQPSAIIFFLKTQGKDRGYIERQEVKIEHDFEDLTDEALAARAAERLAALKAASSQMEGD